jgi:prevent-host-death family protein
MRFVTVRDLRAKTAEVWRDLEDEREMIVTSNGRPVAILAAVDEASFEVVLRAFRRARAIDAVTAMQRDSVLRGADAIEAADVAVEIAAVRQDRRR